MHLEIRTVTMKKPIYILYLLVSCWASSCAVSNTDFTPSKKYSPQQLQEDMQLMEQTLRTNHPSLFWYATPQEIDASFARAYQLLQDSLNEDAFKNIVSETLFPIRCGHTSVRHSGQWNKYTVGKKPTGFPLALKIIDDSTLILTVNYSKTDSILKRGMEIQSINGLVAKKIIDTLFPLVSIDGNAKNFSYQNISNNFQNYYNSRLALTKNYQILYIDSTGTALTITLPALGSLKDTAKPRFSTSTTNNQQQTISVRQRRLQASRSFSIDSSNQFATLRINSFTKYVKPSFIKKTFKQLQKKNISNLILDVRNNGGGLIKSALLLTKHLKQNAFYFTDSIVSTHKKIRSSLTINKKFITNLGMFFFSKKTNDNLYSFSFFKKEYHPKKNNFKGKVIILTGGYSFSATTMFLSSVKGQQNITLLGEETGGGYYGNNGVFIPEMRLPNTKLRVRLPLYRIVNNKTHLKNGSGVVPDVEVKPSAKSIRLNKDSKMEKAIALIKQTK